MNPITRATCCLVLSSLASGAFAATDFNVRAVLDNGDYLAGTVSIDTASGMVVGENATLYRNGAALSTFGAPTGQGPFSVPGLAPSYLFPSQGSNDFVFVGAVPGLSLVGYGGSELCSTTSSVHCATSDLFSGGSFLANVTQGIVARTSDDIRTFALEASFENGTHVSGSVTIDTTIGYVLDEHAFLYSGTTVLSEFSNPLGQNVFAPGRPEPGLLAAEPGHGRLPAERRRAGGVARRLRRRLAVRSRHGPGLRLQRHLPGQCRLERAERKPDHRGRPRAFDVRASGRRLGGDGLAPSAGPRQGRGRSRGDSPG